MNRKKFVEEYTRFVQLALKLAEVSKKFGMISMIESNVWDLDESIFKDGLILISDEADPSTINEILSNKIAHEKNKYMRLYKTIQKRAVLGIQAGESVRIFYKVLSSITGLTSKEERKIEMLLFSDDEPDEAQSVQEDDGKPESEWAPFDVKIFSLNDHAIQFILQELDSDVLAKAFKQSEKKVKEKLLKHLSKRAASMLKEGMEYAGTDGIEEAQQKVLSIVDNLANYTLSKNAHASETTDSDDLDLSGDV
jgi:flagellar motor component MotA